VSGQIHASRPSEGVLLLEIDNPPANVLGAATRALLLAKLDQAEADLSVRAVVLTGRGSAFCAGDNLREEGAMERQDAMANLGQFGRLLDRVERQRAPVIGAVNGHAVGGGLELALCCDIRLAAESATFVAAGVNVGLMASVYRLPRLIGKGAASTMIFTGRPVTAAQALEWGLVTEVHPREALLSAALDLAARIASRAPLSVEASKRMIAQALDLTPRDSAAAAAAELPTLVNSQDHRTAVKAFAERKPPVFTRS
jgi:enoyl-CoA hydratase/carnithine racemase